MIIIEYKTPFTGSLLFTSWRSRRGSVKVGWKKWIYVAQGL